MSEQLNLEDFTPHLNTKFNIYFTDENPVEAELTDAAELRKSPKQETFYITFLVPNDSPIGQGLLKVEHPELKTLELFLVAVGQNKQGIEYESVFNRLIE